MPSMNKALSPVSSMARKKKMNTQDMRLQFKDPYYVYYIVWSINNVIKNVLPVVYFATLVNKKADDLWKPFVCISK